MTEERKQELRQLLNEAMLKLIVLYDNRPSHIPINVYGAYLQERWMHYGVDYLSFSFSTRFWLVIVEENAETKPYDLFNENTKLINFIERELDAFFNGDWIQTANYIVESGFTDGSSLFHLGPGSSQSHHILQRLLEIAIVRGIEEAVLAFERSCCPEGVRGFFQFVALIDGIRIETEIQIFQGVRLIPLPSLKTKGVTADIVRYLPGFPFDTFRRQADSFFGKTLLIIDQPGFSIFHKPPEQLFEPGTKVSDLPFQVEEYDVKFRNGKEINAFIKSFFQALSLVCNSSAYIYHLGWFLAEDKSIQGRGGTIRTRDPFWERRPFVSSTKVEQTEIDKVKRYYKILDTPNLSIAERLQIPIGRWIQSKTENNLVDKIIDLGIALESLYLSDRDGNSELSFQFRLRASWHLGENKADREMLIDEFKAIYILRSKAVHNGTVPDKIRIRKGEEPIATSEFIPRAQDLCRQSILKILEDEEFPDWNNLILGEASL